MEDWKLMVDESFVMWNNYIHTGQTDRANDLLRQLERTIPGDPFIAKCREIDPKNPDPELIAFFGRHWKGENLDGKSIEIICDQGMGDVINMLRYLEEIKRLWKARVVLNCYAYHKQLARLLETVPYIDVFTPHHIPCDFHSNIFSVPLTLTAEKVDTPYPAHFHLLLRKHLPLQTPLNIRCEKRKMRVGIAWKSNALNVKLADMKSMSLEDVKTLVDDRWELYSLLPEEADVDFVKVAKFLGDLYDTASLISSLDVVVSVDTVSLHLAGAMNKKVFGLLAETPDPRWGNVSNTPWYESCRLYRQRVAGDWSHPLKAVRHDLERLYKDMDESGFLNGVVSGDF